MKMAQHQQPLILATARRVSADNIVADEPLIRLKLDKPPHWNWQLTTTADDLPVIQLLDRDGKVLVETNGQVAQKARGSFRDGLKSHESFPEPSKEESTIPAVRPSLGNRNYEGFSTKFGSASVGFRPRKSSSEATVSSAGSHRRKTRKRHSSNASELERPQIKKDTPKRYSAGDYLRQQILEDLTSKEPDTVEPAEVARSQYKKIRSYLRSQSDGVQQKNEAREVLIKDFQERNRKEQSGLTLAGKKLNKDDLDRIKRFLQEKIQARMRQDQSLQRTTSFPVNSPQSSSFLSSYKAQKIEIAAEDNPNRVRERLSDSTGESQPGILKNYRTRKIRSDANIRFDTEAVEVSRNKPENKQYKMSKKDSSGSSDKKKLYRKTKSDVLLSHHLGGSSIDSEIDYPMRANYPTRRIKSQDNFERSWREYKERKKLERIRKDSDHHQVVEEDFMKRPRWKDFQEASCQMRNCKVCENMRNCEDPMESSRVMSEGKKEDSRPRTSLQENYVVIKPPRSTNSNEIIENKREGKVMRSTDFGYNSISKRNHKIAKSLINPCVKSNVKKSDTFKVVDGGNEDDNDSGELCYDYRNKTNEDIARDYFKRVYELLRMRQEDAKKLAEGRIDENCEDTSSSNCLDEEVQIKRRRRRRKMDKTNEGEDVVLGVVSPSRREPWKSSIGLQQQQQQQQQQHQQQEGSSQPKRPRHPPPPPLSSCCSADKENQPGRDEVDRGRPAELLHDMGANLSRHNAKGLDGRRAQSSGNLYDTKGISCGKILAPCSKNSRENKYKFCGSLPNHLDGKNSLDDDTSENNNVITDTICGNLGGTLPRKKSHGTANFSEDSTNNSDLAKHRSDESLDGDPWKYRLEGADLAKCRYAESLRKSRGSVGSSSSAGCHHHHHHHHQHQHEWRRNSSTLSRGRAHRSAELDINGTLPKKRNDSIKRSAPTLGELGDGPTRASRISIDKIDDELFCKTLRKSNSHKSSCELSKHKQQNHSQPNHSQQNHNQQNHNQQGHNHAHSTHQLHKHQGKCVDLKLHKLTTGGEPQDQGYASERSPEDEHPPSLPGQPFPNITPESTFRVTLQKSSRGLGLSVSGGGTSGPVRVKRLFPQQPAALSNKLQPGDILLAANGIPLTGLTNYEALEVLRTTSSTVELVVSRLPGGGETAGTPPGAPPPPPPTRRDNPGLTLKIPLNPLPPLEVEPCGEFDIEMTKVGGSLGFTLRKADDSALGHYVRALVREPALSDGRIRPGDKIIAVDGAPLSPLSHEEAVLLLRKCGPRVRLRLYRDLAQTPVSALSPTEPDHPLRPAKTCLRQEAVDMLCDLAVRKLSPGTSSGSSGPRQTSAASSSSPRRLRRPATRSSTADTDEGGSSSRANRHSHASSQSHDTSDSDACSIKTQITNSAPETPANDDDDDDDEEEEEEEEVVNGGGGGGGGGDIIEPPALYDVCDSSDSSCGRSALARPSYLGLRLVEQHRQYESDECSECAAAQAIGPDVILVTDSDEPASMPPLGAAAAAAFSYRNPAYQSASPAVGQSLPVPDNPKLGHSSDQDIPGKIMGGDDPIGSKGLLKWKGVMFAAEDEADGRCVVREDRRNDSATLSSLHEQGHEVFMVELTRGWNSRLGFSLQPEGENTVISVVHPDSVAAKDGRLKQGDILIMVNDESVEHMSTADIIDLLRKIRGSIGITVLRRKKDAA